jgi:hypothetical protein
MFTLVPIFGDHVLAKRWRFEVVGPFSGWLSLPLQLIPNCVKSPKHNIAYRQMYQHTFNCFDPTIEDAEMVELGLSKEVISEEIYVPCHKSRGWIHCFITLDNDNGYRYGWDAL